jgi:septin family protein
MTEAEFLQADNRIHCVFYFIAPHRLKAIDLEFIKELAPLVPIIPVVSKSDIMTLKERNYYLEAVKQKIDALSVDEPAVYDFQGDDLTVFGGGATDGDEVPPNKNTELVRVPNLFAIVCDNSPERVYPWGKLVIDDNEVSDFRRLQTILFENGMFYFILFKYTYIIFFCSRFSRRASSERYDG